MKTQDIVNSLMDNLNKYGSDYAQCVVLPRIMKDGLSNEDFDYCKRFNYLNNWYELWQVLKRSKEQVKRCIDGWVKKNNYVVEGWR